MEVIIKMKTDGSLKEFYQYAFPMQAVLVTCKDKEKTNIVTVAWHTPISLDPPLYGISLSSKRYSFELIRRSKEFAVNFAPFEILEIVHYCGTHSGRSVDKVKETRLTLIPAKRIKTPLLKECYAHLECKLKDTIELGDHFLVVGEVVSTVINRECFKEHILKIEDIKPVYYLGGNMYTTIDDGIRRKF